MKNKITTSLIAIAAVAALAFTPKAKTEMTYTMDGQKTTATWLATKVTGQHSGTISVAVPEPSAAADGAAHRHQQNADSDPVAIHSGVILPRPPDLVAPRTSAPCQPG